MTTGVIKPECAAETSIVTGLIIIGRATFQPDSVECSRRHNFVSRILNR